LGILQNRGVERQLHAENNWNFAFLLPYESNLVYYEKLLDLPNPAQDTTISVKGWGDLTLAADYIHYIYNPKARHTFRPGWNRFKL
jgi:hypothetical protein